VNSGRGSASTGRRSALPDGPYAPAVPVGVDGLVVMFEGEDGRHRRLDVGRLPLSGWHEPLAAALSRRWGPAGELRTEASARHCWGALGRFMRHLQALPDAPAVPGALTAVHVDSFLRHRSAALGDGYAAREVREVGRLLETAPLGGLVCGDVLEVVRRRTPKCGTPRPGYSDGELSRLIAAARRDGAAIRDRIEAGEAQLALVLAESDAMSGDDLLDAVRLRATAGGYIPHQGRSRDRTFSRIRQAERLFLGRSDLAPLLVLLVALTGWNVETVKELPAEHRILDGRAVELRVVKRRRGSRRWEQTVTWEIGPPHRQLHTAGGIYLLVHRLAARSRELSGGSRLWSIWRYGHTAGVVGPDEHHDPFGQSLGATEVHGPRWIGKRTACSLTPQTLTPKPSRRSL